MRTLLKAKLIGAGSSHNWEHITDQEIVFCGMSAECVEPVELGYSK